jgi:hypothetical protein
LAANSRPSAHGLDRQGHHDLIRHLAGLAVAAATHQRDVLAHQTEHRLDALEHLGFATHHDRQGGVPGAHVTARHGRIQVVAAQRFDLPGELLGVHR